MHKKCTNVLQLTIGGVRPADPILLWPRMSCHVIIWTGGSMILLVLKFSRYYFFGATRIKSNKDILEPQPSMLP
jgi:hypothetical protein